jgi:hypothetical protein
MWCPSCGSEYAVGTEQCATCRVSLITERPAFLDDSGDRGTKLVELGQWPRLEAQVLRRRLETAGIPVMVDWSGPPNDSLGTLLVPEDNADFASAVVNEIEVDDEVASDSPHAYVARIEELLSAAAGLIDELRTRLDELEADGRF